MKNKTQKDLLMECCLELESINKQWNDKKLEDNFFELPYELNELISNVRDKLQSK